MKRFLAVCAAVAALLVPASTANAHFRSWCGHTSKVNSTYTYKAVWVGGGDQGYEHWHLIDVYVYTPGGYWLYSHAHVNDCPKYV